MHMRRGAASGNWCADAMRRLPLHELPYRRATIRCAVGGGADRRSEGRDAGRAVAQGSSAVRCGMGPARAAPVDAAIADAANGGLMLRSTDVPRFHEGLLAHSLSKT